MVAFLTNLPKFGSWVPKGRKEWVRTTIRKQHQQPDHRARSHVAKGRCGGLALTTLSLVAFLFAKSVVSGNAVFIELFAMCGRHQLSVLCTEYGISVCAVLKHRFHAVIC